MQQRIEFRHNRAMSYWWFSILPLPVFMGKIVPYCSRGLGATYTKFWEDIGYDNRQHSQTMFCISRMLLGLFVSKIDSLRFDCGLKSRQSGRESGCQKNRKKRVKRHQISRVLTIFGRPNINNEVSPTVSMLSMQMKWQLFVQPYSYAIMHVFNEFYSRVLYCSSGQPMAVMGKQ